jgi:hypothetical protein
MNRKSIFLLLLVGAIFCVLAVSTILAQNPEIGKAARYCNPLPMIIAPGGNASGDVTVIREKGKYYMFCTGGGAWISDDGLVTDTAHGSVVEGPDGNLWQFYTIVLSNPPGGRRIGMDRITFDKDGYLSVKITDTPQWAPAVVQVVISRF